MTEIEVVAATDAERYLATDHLVWFDEVPDLPAEAQIGAVPPEHRWAAQIHDGPADSYPGVYGVRPMHLGLPGGRVVPMAGLTWVGVHPDHRRRGVLTALIGHHLRTAHAQGLALSALHASEPGIYQRFGYGLAALELAVGLGRGTTMRAPGLEDRAGATGTRMVTASQPGVAGRSRSCDLATASTHPGLVVGSEEFYAWITADRPHQLRDREPLRLLFATRDGRDVGQAAFRREHKWERARPGGRLVVGHLAGDPAARLALLRRLVDFDLMGEVRLERISADDELFAWVGGPRATADVDVFDSTFVRLVDVPAAWAARGYAGQCDVVVRVVDRHAPWNDGRWRLLAAGGEGRAERTDAEAEVTLDVGVLGAGYLGRSIASLLPAGLVREHRTGAYAELAEAIRTPREPSPSAGF